MNKLPDNLHLTFLFASPRYLRLEKIDYEEDFGEIFYKSEFKLLERTFLNKKFGINYRRALATERNLEDSLK